LECRIAEGQKGRRAEARIAELIADNQLVESAIFDSAILQSCNPAIVSG
jgi:hypothetical protein